MKIFSQINGITMKVAKGMVAIFTIKLVLFLAVFTFNACSSEDVEASDNNSAEFKNALDLSMSNVNNIGVFNTNGPMMRSLGSTKTLHLVNDNGQTFSNTDFLNSVTDLQSLVSVQNDRHLTLTQTPLNTNDILATYTIDEQPIVDALQPTIQEARNYLIAEHNFTNQEIDQMIIDKNGTEDDLVPFVMILTSQEQTPNNNSVAFNKSINLFINSAFAQEVQQPNTITWTEVGACALAALGADILVSLPGHSGGKLDKWKRKALLKLFGKVASRLLGPVGVAVAVISFGTCLAAAYTN